MSIPTATQIAPHKHWRERMAERYPHVADPDAVFHEARIAIRDKNTDFAERVIPLNPDRMTGTPRSIWRINHAEEGQIFIVAADKSGVPITCLTRDQVKAQKLARKRGVTIKRADMQLRLRRVADEFGYKKSGWTWSR